MTLCLDDLFPADFDINNEIRSNNIHHLLGVEVSDDQDLSVKTTWGPQLTVDPANTTPFAVEFDDLARLHYLCISRKVTTILEFGVGKSTFVFASALMHNKAHYSEYATKHLRRGNLFELHSVDSYQEWIDSVVATMPKDYIESGVANLYCCQLVTGTFRDQLCTYFLDIPNLSPDLIYIDGPDQFSPKGDIRGLSTRHQDRMPMIGDVLTFEHFLQPGTLIVVDGRTANARFLKSNFQRNWAHLHCPDIDLHYFELQESPLGIFNDRMIKYCLGDSYFERSSLEI